MERYAVADCVAGIKRWQPILRRRGLSVLVLGAAVLIAVVGLSGRGERWVRGTPGQCWLDDDSTGPLGPTDRDLLVRVRTAASGRGRPARCTERAGSDRVKEVGHHLQTDHQALDVQVRAVAAQLGVQLPNEPTAEQKGWLAELSSKTGTDFDRTFADRLRAAHGKVFAIVAAVRAAPATTPSGRSRRPASPW